jgi:heme exporter protein A
MNQKTLQINGICKQYGYINILKDIDIKLSDGNILTLVGPNGAGKSTLLKILSTQVRPTKGEIFYNNIPVYKELNIYRKKLAFLSHKTFLYDDLSAYQNLLFFARLYNLNDPDKKVLELLDFLKLNSRKHDPVKYYSRGMQQKLTIARVMINDPQFIYLDEPYTGLDSRAEDLLSSIIFKKKEEQSIIVLVSHDIEKSYNIATKIMILNKGEVYYSGDKKDITLPQIMKMYREVLEQ